MQVDALLEADQLDTCLALCDQCAPSDPGVAAKAPLGPSLSVFLHVSLPRCFPPCLCLSISPSLSLSPRPSLAGLVLCLGLHRSARVLMPLLCRLHAFLVGACRHASMHSGFHAWPQPHPCDTLSRQCCPHCFSINVNAHA